MFYNKVYTKIRKNVKYSNCKPIQTNALVYMPTPSQVDILLSDDSPAFSPTMYNRIFWVDTRAMSELRVGLVRFNMLKLSSNSFTDSSIAMHLLSIVIFIYILCWSSKRCLQM